MYKDINHNVGFGISERKIFSLWLCYVPEQCVKLYNFQPLNINDYDLEAKPFLLVWKCVMCFIDSTFDIFQALEEVVLLVD